MHLRELPRCEKCGAPATYELRNSWNAVLGVFCSRHAQRALAERVIDRPDRETR